MPSVLSVRRWEMLIVSRGGGQTRASASVVTGTMGQQGTSWPCTVVQTLVTLPGYTPIDGHQYTSKRLYALVILGIRTDSDHAPRGLSFPLRVTSLDLHTFLLLAPCPEHPAQIIVFCLFRTGFLIRKVSLPKGSHSSGYDEHAIQLRKGPVLSFLSRYPLSFLHILTLVWVD